MFYTPLYSSSNTYTQVGIEKTYTILYAYSLRTCSLLILTERTLHAWGTRWCIWLRHCATRRKVASSIPRWGQWNSWLNSSGHTMALGSASNRNEYRGCLVRSKGGRGAGLTTLTPSWADSLEILGVSNSHFPKGPSRPVEGQLWLFILHVSCQHT